MADYYPLIARAIAGLDPNAPGESRRALYERARAALTQQLRTVQPPLSESEITRERLSLEEAVRKVESEAAQRARDTTTRSADASRGGPRPGDSPRSNNRPGARQTEPAPARPRPPSSPQQRNERPPLGPEERQDQRQQRGRPANGRERRAVAPTTPPRRRQACAASATSPPMPMISAVPRRKPAAPHGKPMPTCPRPRRNSTGSSRAWRTAAIPTRPIRTTNPSRRPNATRPPNRSRRARVGRRSEAASRKRPTGQARYFRSRARSRSASF